MSWSSLHWQCLIEFWGLRLSLYIKSLQMSNLQFWSVKPSLLTIILNFKQLQMSRVSYCADWVFLDRTSQGTYTLKAWWVGQASIGSGSWHSWGRLSISIESRQMSNLQFWSVKPSLLTIIVYFKHLQMFRVPSMVTVYNILFLSMT